MSHGLNSIPKNFICVGFSRSFVSVNFIRSPRAVSHLRVLQFLLFIPIYLAVDWFFGDKGIYVPLWNFIVGNIYKSLLWAISDQQCVHFYPYIASLGVLSLTDVLEMWG